MKRDESIKCPSCGTELEHFSGLEKIPAYFYCPKYARGECENNKAYDENGEVIGRLE